MSILDLIARRRPAPPVDVVSMPPAACDLDELVTLNVQLSEAQREIRRLTAENRRLAAAGTRVVREVEVRHVTISGSDAASWLRAAEQQNARLRRNLQTMEADKRDLELRLEIAHAQLDRRHPTATAGVGSRL